MSSEHPQPSLADLLSAIAAEHGEGAAHRAHKAAKKLMWRRLIAANQRAIEAEMLVLRNVTGPALKETQRRLKALTAERNLFLDSAYGRLPGELEARP